MSVRRFLTAFFTLGYIGLIIFCYPEIVHNYYYMGYVQTDNISTIPFVFLGLLSLFPVFLFPTIIQKPSSVVIAVVYYVVYIPSILIPYLIGRVPFEIVLIFDIVLLFSMCVLFGSTYRSHTRVYRYSLVTYKKFLTRGLSISIFFIIALVCLQMIPLFKLVGFEKMYDQRALANNFLKASGFPGIGYFYNWIAAVILPVLIMLGLISRKYYYIVFAFLISFLMYGITASKSVVAIPLVLIIGYIFLHRLRNIPMLYLACGFLGFMMVGFVWRFWLNMIVRRVIITPGMLTSWYLLFSLENPLTYFSDSVLRSVITYPYVNTIPAMVSQYNIGRAFAANANYLAYSTVQFGYVFGPILTSIILGLFLRCYDSIALALIENDHRYYIFSIFILAAFMNALVNTAIFTALFTGGGVLVLLFLYGIFLLKPKSTDELQ